MHADHRRHYLMCRPTYFTVSYEINPWMDRSRPVDTPLAVAQWERLRDTHRDLGHTVETIDPAPGLPDMVYAANGATVVDGLVYSARFRHPERGPEGPAYLKWFADHGYVTHLAEHVNEGEGDLLVAGDVVLAGTGFRTDRAAHAEAAALWGREVVTLELVDPRFYHLDTALVVLRGNQGGRPTAPASAPGASAGRAAGPGVQHPGLLGDPPDVAYYPQAFSPASQEVLRDRFPDAHLASEEDAVVLGLNAVSDGTHVVLNPRAEHLAGALRERGYETVGVDTSELLRGGGGAKCCTLEVRPARDGHAS
ncbi:dimethylarginine dimethylaminohydrolase family protein [Cellulosimicrobium marinum]|uniref:dimethylarginine dimethylaminohydrolase family protein n=1 Tax=Cellulosimicrobium marinum TaxID=1638992 RepID=UPI001E3C5BDB|nr:N-dimethylarginine dimethylaminohydrolase [Cellulosimicrobium marinum]MCB7136957.1 N-dimethylarginine dimethylaminohydrolase [Cellulosimicrobium marinum]